MRTVSTLTGTARAKKERIARERTLRVFCRGRGAEAAPQAVRGLRYKQRDYRGGRALVIRQVRPGGANGQKGHASVSPFAEGQESWDQQGQHREEFRDAIDSQEVFGITETVDADHHFGIVANVHKSPEKEKQAKHYGDDPVGDFHVIVASTGHLYRLPF